MHVLEGGDTQSFIRCAVERVLKIQDPTWCFFRKIYKGGGAKVG